MEDRPKRCDADVHPMLVAADASREDEVDVHHRRTREEQP